MLDTHTLLWAVTAPARLGPAARPLIASTQTQLLVSAASAWEISTKHRLGKLPGADAIVSNLGGVLARLRTTELSVSCEHAILAGRLTWHHRDPFDRMLAAQAMIAGVPLVTDDAALRDLPGLATIW